ncbi:glycosyltransferase family protein [Pontimonas sp.]|nr:glycosyltransferase family protein [Pontimonas sp.]
MAMKEPGPLNVVAVIQARMGSRRFPGKVLADLRGRPVLEWVVDAVQKVEGVHEIVVATTINGEDQAIEDWCEKNGVNCFRGEPLDVLKRYADCAKEYRASHVVRITADCPMLDSETVSTVLRRGLESKADYFGMAGEFPDGFDCEGFSVEALERANREATLQSDREHVTPFLKHASNGLDVFYVQFRTDAADVRLTVDQSEDLDFLESLLELLSLRRGPVQLEKILAALSSAPQLTKINSHIVRNEGYLRSLENDGGPTRTAQ